MMEKTVDRRIIIWSLSLLLLIAQGCSQNLLVDKQGQPCSPAWYKAVEQRISTGDGRGHGPDLGSEEWRSVIEFRLGIRGSPSVPERMSSEWCHYIDRKVFHDLPAK